MRKLYIFALLMLFSLIAQDLFAQKTLRIRISQTFNNISTDCDGFVTGDPDWEWQFDTDGADPCIERDCNCSGAVVRDETLFGTNTYYSRNCWPTGNFNIGFRGFEDDGASNCDSRMRYWLRLPTMLAAYRRLCCGQWRLYRLERNISQVPLIVTVRPIRSPIRYTAQQVLGGSAFNAH
jgi:hypothetical protein